MILTYYVCLKPPRLFCDLFYFNVVPVLSWLINFCQILKSLKISTGCILLWLGMVWMHPGKSGKWRARGNRKELGGGNRKEDMDRNQSLAGNSCYLVELEDIDTARGCWRCHALSHWPHPNCRNTKIKTIQKCKRCAKIHMYSLNQMVAEGGKVHLHIWCWQVQCFKGEEVSW